MFAVGETVAHHSVKEVVYVVANVVIDGGRDALDSSSSGQSADGSVGDVPGLDGFV